MTSHCVPYLGEHTGLSSLGGCWETVWTLPQDHHQWGTRGWQSFLENHQGGFLVPLLHARGDTRTFMTRRPQMEPLVSALGFLWQVTGLGTWRALRSLDSRRATL